MNRFNSTTPNFDNLLLQSLMGRLQIHQSPPPSTTNHNHPLFSPSFEDLLLPDFNSDSESDPETDTEIPKSRLSKEESKLEKELIKTIQSGNTDSLKPNSGQAVSIGEHHICVGSHQDPGSEYRVWEWHGHIMLFDEENGYTPEYIYGNYFERLVGSGSSSGSVSKKEEKVDNLNLGLRELIDAGDSGGSRVLHRGRSVGSPQVLGSS